MGCYTFHYSAAILKRLFVDGKAAKTNPRERLLTEGSRAPLHCGLSAPRSRNITFNPFRQSAARPTRSTSIAGAK